MDNAELGQAVIRAATDGQLFGRHFQPPESWQPWLVVLKVLFGLTLTAAELVLFQECTGRSTAFAAALGEAWLLCGRRSGKSRILALVATVLATFRDYAQFLAPGEKAVIMILAADRDQAQVIFQYVRALLIDTPMLAGLIQYETADELTLSNHVVIGIYTSSYKSIRGRTLAAALCDEVAFWRSDESRNPGAAVLAALRPSLATIPGAPLLIATSTYGMSGVAYEAFLRHFAHDDSGVMVWKAPTLTMNPSFRREVVVEALARDPQSAAAEYGSEFLTDLRAFLDEAVLQDSIDHGCHERPASGRGGYQCFVDPSGGRRDSFTAAIAHKHGDIAFLDLVREYRPPLDPAIVVADIATAVRPYGITKVIGDAYGAEWPVSLFRNHGLTYQTSDKNRSEIYLETGPLLAQGKARLIDVQRLTAQLRQLERRASPSGRDRVDHGPGGADDVANSAMGAIYLAAIKPSRASHSGQPRQQFPYSVM